MLERLDRLEDLPDVDLEKQGLRGGVRELEQDRITTNGSVSRSVAEMFVQQVPVPIAVFAIVASAIIMVWQLVLILS